MKNPADARKFQTGNVVLIAFSHLIHDIYGSFLAPILPLLIEKLGFSYTLAGFLAVAQRFPSLLNPLLGVIADRTSVRYFLIIAPTVTAISMSLLGSFSFGELTEAKNNSLLSKLISFQKIT